MAYTPKKKIETENNKPQQEFAKGVSVKVQETKFGDIIKVGLNVEGKQFSPHNIRNFVATYLVQKEVNEVLIKDLLHWSQNTSSMIARYSTKDIKQFDQQKIEIMNIL